MKGNSHCEKGGGAQIKSIQIILYILQIDKN